ncbi:4-hydroxyphenylpyruvate dioxygenase [Fulvivirga imtechensis AK7]|uniref:4-hydroxyphenylpyruvate dioxygenase n=1 Tax=Fulvivirga imtechensis AK7 TaxID=1237149 RepID=L8JM44_9BACT|nr:VOC family protein [Fulvivirga imtechensis]ELR68462.1 4-hydroxyphenylpyruvate dioxygenase [Fulvivirga imtechensis AK7]
MSIIKNHIIDHVEIYTPLARPYVYWHVKALGFNVEAFAGNETGVKGVASYVLTKNNIRLVITSAFPPIESARALEVQTFTNNHSVAVRRIALKVSSVEEAFHAAVEGGAMPERFPVSLSDENGIVEEASIRLYDHSEIVFINREKYNGTFKPGYERKNLLQADFESNFTNIDHIASELRVNEINFWTEYLHKSIGTDLVQSIGRGGDNETGMVLNINQSPDKNLTLVMAEPEGIASESKIQKNIDTYGAGIHHLAFATDDLPGTVKLLRKQGVDFVQFPKTYYEILREKSEFADFDIEELEKEGILIDKEGSSYLLQKFIKPSGDRPFFFYEIVQRVNGYNGFALKNINVLKKAEERQIMRSRLAETEAG